MNADHVIASLVDVEAQLRDLAYEALRRAADGDSDGEAEERQFSKARRAVAKAIRDLGGVVEEF
ncbi:MAG: hypothetical protein ACOYN3_06360 [Acidimicrobiia bacterium]